MGKDVKVYVNNKRIVAPVSILGTRVSILMATFLGQREWIYVDEIAASLGGEVIFDKDKLEVYVTI